MGVELLLDGALAILKRMALEAIWDGNRCTWLSGVTSMSIPTRTDYVVMSADFYGGTSGVAWSYMNAYLITEDLYYKKFAIGALNHAIQERDKMKYAAESFYSGKMGIVFVCLHAAVILKEPQFETQGMNILAEIDEIPAENYGMDIINGPAGSIGKVLDLYILTSGQFEVDTILEKLSNYYIAKKLEYNGFSVWDTMPECVAPMTGYAHGMSGIAGGLLEAFRFNKDERFLQLAESAMDYENTCYNAQVANWPDYRNLDKGKKYEMSYAMAWCHGAPGIGLQRLRAYEITKNERWLKDASAASEKTWAHSMQCMKTHAGNFSLCHGIFGNNELLLEYSVKMNDPKYSDAAMDTGYEAVSKIEKSGLSWPCGLHNLEETTGFMLGISGIAYHLMRLYNPTKLPCILC